MKTQHPAWILVLKGLESTPSYYTLAPEMSRQHIAKGLEINSAILGKQVCTIATETQFKFYTKEAIAKKQSRITLC